MNKNNTPKKRATTPAFETLAVLEHSRTEPVTNAAIPSDQAVDEAKKWVDYNEK